MKLSPPGNQAPLVKASRCGNERLERSGKGKRVVGKWRKKFKRKNETAYLLIALDAGVLPGGPHPDGQDEDVEDDDRDHSQDVDHFD